MDPLSSRLHRRAGHWHLLTPSGPLHGGRGALQVAAARVCVAVGAADRRDGHGLVVVLADTGRIRPGDQGDGGRDGCEKQQQHLGLSGVGGLAEESGWWSPRTDSETQRDVLDVDGTAGREGRGWL